MIAAENYSSGLNIGLAGQCEDEFAEIGWLHAGVAAVLIDLVAGCLNQNRLVIVLVVTEDRAQGFGMRSAVGRDTGMVPCPADCNDLLHARCAKKVSICFSELLPSIGPTLVTANAPAALAYCKAF